MLDLTGNAWQREAGRLAQWTQERLVNRTDVYGSYLPIGSRQPGKSNNYTAPNKALRAPGALTTEIIEEHFRGYDQGKLIGLHAISPDCTCRWFLVDIDQHGDDQAALAAANAKAAFGWHADLQQRGFHPLLLDSNGRGGYHLLVVLSEPVASQRVHAFATQFVQDYAHARACPGSGGLPQAARRERATPLRQLGRLPGRHHTRDHWTKVWDGTAVARRSGRRRCDPQRNRRFAGADSGSACKPVRRVGVGLARPQYVSAYGTDDWLEILQGTGPGNRHDSLLRLAGFLLGNGCRRRWSKSCASSGMRPETTRHARKSMSARRCRTLFNGI